MRATSSPRRTARPGSLCSCARPRTPNRDFSPSPVPRSRLEEAPSSSSSRRLSPTRGSRVQRRARARKCAPPWARALTSLSSPRRTPISRALISASPWQVPGWRACGPSSSRPPFPSGLARLRSSSSAAATWRTCPTATASRPGSRPGCSSCPCSPARPTLTAARATCRTRSAPRESSRPRPSPPSCSSGPRRWPRRSRRWRRASTSPRSACSPTFEVAGPGRRDRMGVRELLRQVLRPAGSGWSWPARRSIK
mmetsp:Transcript_1957/g.5573  ORF Transcript_1957/g.5573 Transcript_1957/m.5573 type:complete len:253 (-) Transcript_1957:20-778(-)